MALSELESDRYEIGDAIAQGSRVQVFRLKDKMAKEQRVVRLPLDREKDEDEIRHLEGLLELFEEFFPDPSLISLRVNGDARRVISSNLVNSEWNRKIPSANMFRDYLENSKLSLGQKMNFLRNLKEFIERCKVLYWTRSCLPDLAGRGNLSVSNDNLFLLDSNNVSSAFVAENGAAAVPLDDAGLPIFDLSLQLLYAVERDLLTYVGGNFSTQGFNRIYRKETGIRGVDLPSELEKILIPRDEVRRDLFYGAVRFQQRRELARTMYAKREFSI